MEVMFQISTILDAQLLRKCIAKTGRGTVRVCFFASLFTSERPGNVRSHNLKIGYLSFWALKIAEIWNITYIYIVALHIKTLKNPNQMERK